MENSSIPLRGDTPDPLAQAEPLTKQFVAHWGLMARAWGINASMGELFALLYITGTDWYADDLRQWLGVSRANVSMNLRELISWGVVHKIRRPGERRELFRAETDAWTLFRKILRERKRRELDPSLHVLERAYQQAEHLPEMQDMKDRIQSLRRFFMAIDTLAVHLLSLPSLDLAEISHLGSGGEESSDEAE